MGIEVPVTEADITSVAVAAVVAVDQVTAAYH